MTPADERILQLLEKWHASLELHDRYLDLSDAEYQQIQPWPPHQRPNRVVVQLARQRVADLRRILQGRLATGDQSLSEALELMSFLTNLVGSQNVQRFIPLAEPAKEGKKAPARTAKAPRPEPKPTGTTTRTRTMPKLKPRPGARVPGAADQTEINAVMADAVRLLGWGKEWHELPDAIARIEGRPDRAAIQRMLKTHRTDIERRTERADDAER